MLYATAIKYQVRHIKFRSEFYMFSINIPKINENSRMCILALKFVLILGLDWSGANYIHYKKSTAGKGLSSLQITFLLLVFCT